MTEAQSERCPKCGGDGFDMGYHGPYICGTCHGTGKAPARGEEDCSEMSEPHWNSYPPLKPRVACAHGVAEDDGSPSAENHRDRCEKDAASPEGEQPFLCPCCKAARPPVFGPFRVDRPCGNCAYPLEPAARLHEKLRALEAEVSRWESAAEALEAAAKAKVDAATAEAAQLQSRLDEWQMAWSLAHSGSNPAFGPRTPQEVVVFERERLVFNDEIFAHMKARLDAIALLRDQWWHHGDEVDAMYAEKLDSALAAGDAAPEPEEET